MTNMFKAIITWLLSNNTTYISLFALIISTLSYFRTRAKVVNDFFLEGDSTEMRSCRQKLYDIYNDIPQGINETEKKIWIREKLIDLDKDMAQIVSFYDKWCLLRKHHYLPKWVFEDAAGHTAKNVYKKLGPYIEYRREQENEKNPKWQYAWHFEKYCG